jgi:glycerol-3-phosphate dehydrogenase
MDVMMRRTELSMVVSHRLQEDLAGRIARIMARVYGWDEQRTQDERSRYLDHVRKTIFSEAQA